MADEKPWEGFDPRFDGGPAKRPYPEGMPTLNTVRMSGPGVAPDVHSRALRNTEQLVHNGIIVWRGGDRSGTKQLVDLIRRRKALREELGEGVVEFTAAEREVLAFDDPSAGFGVAA